MITAWAVYGIALAFLFALAARAAEETLSAWGLPTRWVWVGAIVGSLTVPAALRWDLGGRAVHQAGELLNGGGGEAAAGATPAVGVGAVGAVPPPGPAGWPELLHFPVAADRALLALWLAGTALLLGGAVRAWWRLRRGRRSWPVARIDGTEVRVSSRTGPAVTGVADPVIVVPRRVLRLPADQRRLLIRHELEHRDARDPAVLAVGLAALAACPWNPALWWAVRRLRLAVERDCDRRVLEAGADPRTYGSVLLAEAGGRPSPLPTAAMGQGRSHLERRIRSLTAGVPRFRTLRSVVAVAAAAGLLFVACDAPTPSESAPDGERVAATAKEADDGAAPGAAPGTTPSPDVPGTTSAAGDRPRFIPRDADPRAINDEEIRDLLVRHYPPPLEKAGVGGTVTLWLYTSRSGEVEEVRVQTSSGYASMDRAAAEVARRMEFEPATRDGEPVGVWISRNVTFRPESGAEAASGGTDRDGALRPEDVRGVEVDREEGTVDLSGTDGRVVKIRGDTTIELSSVPLIFLDGERVDAGVGVLEDLDPDDIESIEVIKGPAAERLYGEAAADGVIRIETKGRARN